MLGEKEKMSYREALQAAGAEVLAFEYFGSHQGDWWAKVSYKGEIGWVQGAFGSCDHNDAFDAEFGSMDAYCEEHKYEDKEDCQACREAGKKYDERLADFGRGYLDGLLTQEMAEEEAARDIDWDSEAQTMLDWLKLNTLDVGLCEKE